MATRYVFDPSEVEITLGDVPYRDRIQGRPLLVCPDAIWSTWRWTFIAPPDLVAPVSLIFHGFSGATSGNVRLAVRLEAITPGDTVNLNISSHFALSDNQISAAVPATAGVAFAASLPLTNDDGMVDGDLVWIEVIRLGDDALDTAAGSYYLLTAELRDSA